MPKTVNHYNRLLRAEVAAQQSVPERNRSGTNVKLEAVPDLHWSRLCADYRMGTKI